jgi:hypothetical protein
MQDAGPFEVLFLAIIVTAGHRLRHLESFDVGDTDRALARFAELCIENGERERLRAGG